MVGFTIVTSTAVQCPYKFSHSCPSNQPHCHFNQQPSHCTSPLSNLLCATLATKKLTISLFGLIVKDIATQQQSDTLQTQPTKHDNRLRCGMMYGFRKGLR